MLPPIFQQIVNSRKENIMNRFKNIILAILALSYVVSVTLMLVSCEHNELLRPTRVYATTIVMDSSANAHAFTDHSFAEVGRILGENIYASHASIVIANSDISKWFSFPADANNVTVRDRRIREYSDALNAFLRDESNRAERRENNLLYYIEQGARTFEVSAGVATEAGQEIIANHLIIMSAGISTDGSTCFIRLGLDILDYENTPPEELEALFREIAGDLNRRRLLPCLAHVTYVTWIGIGDRSPPLSGAVRNGIEQFWRIILSESGAGEVTVTNLPNGNQVNLYIVSRYRGNGPRHRFRYGTG